MPRKKRSEEENQIAQSIKIRNRLNSLKNELEGGRIMDFSQVFSIISLTSLSKKIGMSIWTFQKKADNPTEFTIGEIIRLSDLFGVSYTIMHVFICKCIEQNKKLPFKIT